MEPCTLIDFSVVLRNSSRYTHAATPLRSLSAFSTLPYTNNSSFFSKGRLSHAHSNNNNNKRNIYTKVQHVFLLLQ